MRSWKKVGTDTVQGAARGAVWGAGLCALAVLAVPFTGGASLAALSAAAAALPAAGGAAVAGAKVGGVVGGLMGAAGEKEHIDKVAVGIAAAGLGSRALSDSSKA